MIGCVLENRESRFATMAMSRECGTFFDIVESDMKTTKELREDYRRMDATWPRPLPPVTFNELKAAYKRLRAKFRPNRPGFKMRFKQTSGNREHGAYLTSILNGPRFLQVTLNPDRGWDDFIHWLSHNFAGGHHDGHINTEWAMIKHVRESGWLDGKLRQPEKPAVPSQSLVERRAAKAKRLLDRAEKELAAAQKRAKKWRAKVNYYETRLAT